MDLAARFILAWETTADKISHDATKILEAAKAKAGKPLITDGLSCCHTAFKRMFGTLKDFSMHLWNGFFDTSKQESASNTSTGRARPARGINSKNSLVCHIFMLHCIWPHSGIGSKTPAKATGIEIQGHNKCLTLIQNATDAA